MIGMSDSTGSTKLPEVTRASSPLSSAKGEPPLNAKLIGVPNATEGRNDRVVRLKGEIVQASNEGRVTIKTQSGEIEVQLPPEAKQTADKLTRGQKVQIDIPPEKVRNRTDNTVHIRKESTREINTGKKTETEAKTEPPPQTRDATKASRPERSVEIKTLPYTPPADIAKKATEGVEQRALSNAQGVKAQMQAILSKTTLQHSDGVKLQGVTVRLDPLPAEMLTQITTSPPQITLNTLPATVQTLAQSLPIKINNETNQILLQALPATAATSTAQTTIENLLQQPQKTAQAKNTNIFLNQYLTDTKINQNIQSSIALSASTAATPSLQWHPLDANSNFSPQKIDIIKHLSVGAIKTFLSNRVNTPTQNTNAPPDIFTASLQQITLPEVKLFPPEESALPSSSSTPNSEIPLKEFLKILAADAQKTTNIQQPALAITPESDNLKITALQKPDIFALNTSVLTQSQIGTITATLSGYTPQNLPVLSFFPPEGGQPQSFILQLPLQNLAPGTTFEITPQLTGVNAQAAASASTALPAPSTLITPGHWPTMEEIAQTLSTIGTNNTIAAGASTVLPSPSNPAQMAPAVLFIMAALKSGDLAQTLNDKAQDMLRRSGKGRLLNRLSGEGSIINRTHVDSAGQDWRALTIPLQWEQDIHKAALFYKHSDNEDSESSESGGKQTRFIFDLALSQMGKVQLDGLHRNDRLDLIVRTQEPFSRVMQLQMKSAYADAMDMSDLAGDLSFQNDPQSWVNIQVQDNETFKANI